MESGRLTHPKCTILLSCVKYAKTDNIIFYFRNIKISFGSKNNNAMLIKVIL